MIRFSCARTAFLLCALFISGCASLPRGPGVAVDPAQVQAFELNGRINVRAKESAYPGRIRWQHEPRRDEVWLYSPLGSAVAHIEQNPSGATLATSDGKTYRGADANVLARDVLGYDLPLDALQFWVRGLPAPRLSGTERTDDAQGRPEVIQQGGWKVSYLDWAPAGADGLPSKLDVAGTGVRMRLVVDEWKINERRP